MTTSEPVLDTAAIRNVVLVGHTGTGKTSLVEAMLLRAGVTTRLGRVEDGTTVTDDEPEEKARGQSLRLAVASFLHQGHRVNVLDTPGHADLRDDVLMGMTAGDLMVLVVDAGSGLQAGDAQLWRTAAAMGLPRMVFINKMDRPQASFEMAVGQARAQLGEGIELVELPLGQRAGFRGVADLVTEHVFLYGSGTGVEGDQVPAELAAAEHDAHEHLVEDVVEWDDALLERYLEGEEPTVDQLWTAIHDGVDAGRVFPVLCGTATGPIGVDRLLDLVCRIGPSPADLPGTPVSIDGQVHVAPCDADGPLLLQVIATRADDYMGQITQFKVVSGTLHGDDVLITTRTGRKERLHGLMRLHGTAHHRVATVVAGDIAAVTKLGDVRTGDTLSEGDRGWQVVVPPPAEPVHGIAISVRTPGEDDKLVVALARVLAEDRSLRVTRDDETHQTVLSGAGDLQLQVVLERIARRHGIVVDTEPVRIAYRETITRPVTAEGRHKKQSGGRGQFAVATVRFEPGQDEGLEFTSEVVGGAIPRGLVGAVGVGIEEAMARGGLHGFPLVGLRATVLDGRHHAVDSDEVSFRTAGSLALRAALPDAGVVVLEPLSHVEVSVPVELQGEVMGDLQQRRGQIETTMPGETPDEVVVTASVPTAEIQQYAVDLRSFTHGRARFTARHDRYQPLPPHLVDTLPG